MLPRLKHCFQNSTDRPWFVTLELSTARYRLDPGAELILFHGTDGTRDEHGAVLRTQLIINGDHVELVVWTSESQLFFPDGRPAPQNYDPG